jgi:hypothetical protein
MQIAFLVGFELQVVRIVFRSCKDRVHYDEQ